MQTFCIIYLLTNCRTCINKVKYLFSYAHWIFDAVETWHHNQEDYARSTTINETVLRRNVFPSSVLSSSLSQWLYWSSFEKLWIVLGGWGSILYSDKNSFLLHYILTRSASYPAFSWGTKTTEYKINKVYVT